MKSGGKMVMAVLAVWFCLALGVGFTGWFGGASALAVAATVWILTALALLLCWKAPGLNRWLWLVDLRWLIGLHLIRFVAGVCFLRDARAGILSPAFALPAAYGDMAVALLAALILIIPGIARTRGLVLFWNGLGLFDILFVVSNALRVGLRDWPGMAPLREFPLVLLPTFLVPLVIASHVLIFVRLGIRGRIAPQ